MFALYVFLSKFSFIAIVNLNYSYRSLLITTLLFGILFLAFKSVTLSKYEIVKEEGFDVEYSEEDLLLEEEELASLSQRDLKIETNRAFNEAERFISELENERETVTETLEGKEQIQEVLTDAPNAASSETGANIHKKSKSERKEDFSNGTNETKKVSVTNSSKKNSTVSYRLLKRSALNLPNPVYTCEIYGKVVINIEVSKTGRVKKATYSKKGSTTKNECLIDNALTYAKSARFTTNAQKIKQLGTITYNFPGQQ